MLKSTPDFSYFSQTVVKFGAMGLFVPGGEFKMPCCGGGSSRRAGFHLNFEP